MRSFPFVAVILVASGCSCPSDDGQPTAQRGFWTGAELDETSHQRAVQLDRLSARLQLPASNLEADASEGTFVLTNLRPQVGSANRAWTTQLPFVVPKSERRFAPDGMRVLIGDEELDFNAGETTAFRARTWRFEQDRIVVSSTEPVTELRIAHPELVKSLRRMNFGTASKDGMSADAFVRYSTTLGTISREGLLLPAPTTATWSDLEVPEDGRFEAHLAMASTPMRSRSDGATVRLSVQVGETDTQVAETQVAGRTESFARWTVDLSEYAGQTVDLTIQTDPNETNLFDYVFIGSPSVVGKPEGKVKRVVVIGIDTLRPDHLSINGYERNTTPELDAWARNAVRFERAWTSAPRTRPSFRAATTGRLPLEAVCAKNIGEVFDEAGFATAGIVANVHLNPRFDFDRGFDMWWLDGAAKVNEQVERAIDFLDENAQRDTYLFLHVMDPHLFYRAPEPYGSRFTADLPPLAANERLPPKYNRWHVYKWARQGGLSLNRRAHIEAEYDGELAYTSAQLGILLKHIEELPGESIVLLHNDHGEEFWEHDGYEHNHTLYDDTTRALMWIKPPGGSGLSHLVNPYPSTLQDIGPTVFELAGLPPVDGLDGKSLVPAMRGQTDTEAWDRPIPIAHLRYDADRWGVVWNDHKYVLVTGTGAEELYDLANDPGERNNLAKTVDTAPYARQLAAAHRIQVDHGWRIDISMKRDQVITLDLPAKATAAAVLDPEVITRKPVNQVWGEVPRVLPDDVATVALSSDGKTLELRAGKRGKGIVYVLFEDLVAAEGTVLRQESAATPVNAQGQAKVGANSIHIQPGWVIVPPAGEAQRIAACTQGSGTDAELEWLKDVGYVDGD